MWVEKKEGLYYDQTMRVTFAKRKTGEYVFLGVYKPEGVVQKILEKNLLNRKGEIVKTVGDTVWIKRYKLILDTYKN